MMSADIDNQPYDNVEFPIRRQDGTSVGGGGGSPAVWVNPFMTATQRETLVTGGTATRERPGFSLPPVAEGGGPEVDEDDLGTEIRVEDPRQRAAVTQINVVSPTNANNSALTVITTPPRASNHVITPTKQQNVNGNDKRTNHSQNLLKQASPKPPPSPSRDSHQSLVIDQSKQEDFTWGAFTPMSQEVFENAHTRHKYFYKFSDKVLKQGTKMKVGIWDAPGKPCETMTYEQLLQGVLSEGERLLLGGSWLYFRDVEFQEAGTARPIKPPLGDGRICLTNRRMLLMCAEMSPGASISEFGEPAPSTKGGSGGYKLTVSKVNHVFFQNIPIDCFESVELSSSVGVMAESKLSERKPACCGLFSCVGVGSCGYTWDATPPLSVNIVKRVIRLGVYLPPWRTPAVLLVHLHPKMSLTGARDFVAQLQNHVPQMQYRARQGATVL